MFGGVVTDDDASLQWGQGGGQESWKKGIHNLNYVINYVICKLLSSEFVFFLLKISGFMSPLFVQVLKIRTHFFQ